MMDKVSFLIPVYNEEAHIDACLESIASQDVPLEQLEVLIADGNSTDKTLQKIDEFRKANPSLSVIVEQNPSRNTAVGRNICMEAASGDLVLNFSGHAMAEPNLVTVLKRKMHQQPTDVAAVGAATRTKGSDTFLGRAISSVLSSPMGGGNSIDSNFNADREQFARSIAFALYRKHVITELGGFDETLWCGQDAELNYRLRRNGYRILYTPETGVFHYKRASLGGFIQQMYRYGVARAMILRKFPESLRAIYLMPAIFSLLLAIGVVAAGLSESMFWIMLMAVLLFIGASFAATTIAGGGLIIALVSAVLYGGMYLSYGIGFLRGFAPIRA